MKYKISYKGIAKTVDFYIQIWYENGIYGTCFNVEKGKIFKIVDVLKVKRILKSKFHYEIVELIPYEI